MTKLNLGNTSDKRMTIDKATIAFRIFPTEKI
jgi:hypothetical protein